MSGVPGGVRRSLMTRNQPPECDPIYVLPTHGASPRRCAVRIRTTSIVVERLREPRLRRTIVVFASVSWSAGQSSRSSAREDAIATAFTSRFLDPPSTLETDDGESWADVGERVPPMPAATRSPTCPRCYNGVVDAPAPAAGDREVAPAGKGWCRTCRFRNTSACPDSLLPRVESTGADNSS
jgi:hypothetical protein